MKDPNVQEAVTRLNFLIAELNEINKFFHEEGVGYSIKETNTPGNGPRVFKIDYLTQSVKYD